MWIPPWDLKDHVKQDTKPRNGKIRNWKFCVHKNENHMFQNVILHWSKIQTANGKNVCILNKWLVLPNYKEFLGFDMIVKNIK